MSFCVRQRSICNPFLPKDPCAIHLVTAVPSQVGEQPCLALEGEVAPSRQNPTVMECWQALGLCSRSLSKTRRPLGHCVLLGFSKGSLWRLPLHAPPSCITHTWALPEAWGPITGLGARHALARLSVIAGSNCSVLPFASACSPADLQFKQAPLSPHLPSSLPALFPPPLWPLHRVPDMLTDSRWLFHTANCLNNKQANKKELEIS